MKKPILTMILTVLAAGTACAQSVWDATHLQAVKAQVGAPAYAPAYKQLLRDAEKQMKQEPLSVMQKSEVAASGDKHDYVSRASYFWPDPTKPDGKPYVRHDGKPIPDADKIDRPRMAAMAKSVTTLSLAYYLSGEERFAEKATELLRVWFLDKDTKMNPNFNYAQMIPGENGDKGRKQGIIDSYVLVDMLDGVQLLEHSKAFTQKDSKKLKAWFGEFLDWLLTSDLGKGEAKSKNNHGTAYDVQVMAFARYAENKAVLKQYLDNFVADRIDKQIEADGKQPLELARTLGFGYSVFNLKHIIDAFFIAKHAGMEVGGNRQEAFAKVEKALDFLTPYLGKTVEDWKPYQQISKWEAKQAELCDELYRASLLDPARTDYVKLYEEYGSHEKPSRFTLLYVETK